MFDFYSSILNLSSFDFDKAIGIIANVINKEKEEVLKYTSDFEGLCKIFGYNIKSELLKYHFKVNDVNINKLNDKIGEHIFLITCFKERDIKINYVLIDPTYIQFCWKKNHEVYKFNDYPGEILKQNNKKLYDNLLNNGFSIINKNDFNDYLGCFGINGISLEDIILKKYKEDNYEIDKRNHP